MRDFKAECFDRLPPDAQGEVMRLLWDAILWRGWDAGPSRPRPLSHADRAVREIAGVFERHGMEFEEYT